MAELNDTIISKAASIQALVLDVDGVLTDGTLPFDAQGREQKVFHARDGYGLRSCMKAGIAVAIISGRQSVAVEARLAELGIRDAWLACPDKLAALDELTARLNITREQIAYVGDDTPDRCVLEVVGLAIAVADAHESITDVIHWQTDLPGGRGAVRQVCDLLLSARS